MLLVLEVESSRTSFASRQGLREGGSGDTSYPGLGLGGPIVADLIKKKGKCIKSHTFAPKLTFCYLENPNSTVQQCTRVHISRDPTAFQPQRAESKLAYYTTIIK